MKKIVSLLLALLTCFLLCATLSSCGKKNAYQTFIKENFDKEFKIEKIEGTPKRDIVTDYYKLNGDLNVTTKGVMSAYVQEFTRVAEDDNECEIDVQLYVRYDMRETVVEVIVESYSYSCEPIYDSKKEYYDWKDGVSFKTPKNSDGAILTRFKFDINTYFENGKLTVADAEEAMALDKSGIVKDLSWPTTDAPYTSRNTDWEAEALAHIMDTVNATLAEIDAIVDGDAK